MKVHVLNIHKAKEKQECDICNKQFFDLKKHTEYMHLRQNSHKCDQCDFTTKRPGLLVDHVNRMHNRGSVKLVKCDICHLQLTSETNLSRHMKNLHENDDYKKWFHCQYCEFTSLYIHNLEGHVQNMHPSEDRQKDHEQYEMKIAVVKLNDISVLLKKGLQ